MIGMDWTSDLFSSPATSSADDSGDATSFGGGGGDSFSDPNQAPDPCQSTDPFDFFSCAFNTVGGGVASVISSVGGALVSTGNAAIAPLGTALQNLGQDVILSLIIVALLLVVLIYFVFEGKNTKSVLGAIPKATI